MRDVLRSALFFSPVCFVAMPVGGMFVRDYPLLVVCLSPMLSFLYGFWLSWWLQSKKVDGRVHAFEELVATLRQELRARPRVVVTHDLKDLEIVEVDEDDKEVPRGN